MESTQEEVYRIVAQKAMEDIFSGYNSSLFAYGQTGSGKSWTMFGSLKDLNHRGLVPRCTEAIFQTIKSGSVRGSTITLSCSYLEIYQEIITDLLKPSNTNLQIRETPELGVFVQGVSQEFVGSVVDVYALMALGDVGKRKCATSMNPNSSRSHCCFSIIIEQKTTEGKQSRAQLNLIDLAGSERVAKSQAVGQSFEEAKKINLSLTMLSQVINALADNSSHVPYRGSKLTRLLQNSLGGNSKTSIVVACSPHPDNRDETLSSLRFAQRCACVKNKVRQNTVLSAQELQAMLDQANSVIMRSGAKPGQIEVVDHETQTEDVAEASTTVAADDIDLERLVFETQRQAAATREAELKDQLAAKQLEIDTLSQRLLQSNQRILDALAANKNVSHNGTTPRETPRRKGSGSAGPSLKSLKAFGTSFRRSSAVLGGGSKKKNFLGSSPSLGVPKSEGSAPFAKPRPQETPDITVTLNIPSTETRDELVSGTVTSSDASDAVVVEMKRKVEEREQHLAVLSVEMQAEERKLENIRLQGQLEELTRAKVRLATQCEDQDHVITRQQEVIKNLSTENSSLKQLKRQIEEQNARNELEIAELKERAWKAAAPVDDGGATIVVPLQDNSVLQGLRDQQAIKQLGKLLDVFSFGFGGGDAPPAEDDPDAAPAGVGAAVGDRVSRVFNTFNPFASVEDPKPLPVDVPATPGGSRQDNLAPPKPLAKKQSFFKAPKFW
eukprot:c4415_g1_i2.p1 GENE.c4415_g1_i2~~c4415_g1_i2.p1  ORF type:complete len:725 (-),score=169.32 c4415_g1_i2:171-2345(-)